MHGENDARESDDGGEYENTCMRRTVRERGRRHCISLMNELIFESVSARGAPSEDRAVAGEDFTYREVEQ